MPAQRPFDRYSYPRLAPNTPVLQRGHDAVQIGLSPGPAVILQDMDPSIGTVISLLDGCHHVREIHATGQLDPGLIDWTLSALDQAGLLSEGVRPRPARSELARIRLVGAGTLGKEMARHLARPDVDVLYLVDNNPLDSSLYPGLPRGATCAEALRRQLLAMIPAGQRVVAVNHWTKPEGAACHFTIVATDAAECDRAISDSLLRDDQSHLFVRTLGEGVVVGPLVVPGQSACMRCLDLTRCEADANWPLLVAQLPRIRTTPVPLLTHWAAAVAATQVWAFLGGHRPESFGSTIEITPDSYATRLRRWPMHPACGCGWSGNSRRSLSIGGTAQ